MVVGWIMVDQQCMGYPSEGNQSKAIGGTQYINYMRY